MFAKKTTLEDLENKVRQAKWVHKGIKCLVTPFDCLHKDMILRRKRREAGSPAHLSSSSFREFTGLRS